MASKVRALQQWCKIQCDGYYDVNVTNMTSSWKSGLAFCAIIHKYRPDLIDYDSLSKENVLENNQLAFETAFSLGIPKLLDAEDMVEMRVPDKLCIVTYVSQYYNYFRDKPPGGGGIIREKSAVKRQPTSDLWSSGPEAKKVTPGSPTLRQDTNMAGLHENLQKTDTMNKRGTLTDKCVMCGGKVYLMERHVEDTKLYHRRCIRETQRATLKRESKASSNQKSQSHRLANQSSLGRKSSDQQSANHVSPAESKVQSNARNWGKESSNTSHMNAAKPLLDDSKNSPNRSPDNPFRKEMAENVVKAKPFSPSLVKATPVIEREPVKVVSKFSKPSDFKTKTSDEPSPKSKLDSPTKSSHHRNEFLNDLSPTKEQTSSPDPKKSKFEQSSTHTKWGSNSSPEKNSLDTEISAKNTNRQQSGPTKNESSVFSGLLKSLAGVKKPKDFDEPMQAVYETEKTDKKTNRKSWLAAPGETSAESNTSFNKDTKRHSSQDALSKLYTNHSPNHISPVDKMIPTTASSSQNKLNHSSPRTAIRRSPPLPKFGSTKNTNLEKHDSFNDIFAANKEVVDQYGLGDDLELSVELSTEGNSPAKKQTLDIDNKNATNKTKTPTGKYSNGQVKGAPLLETKEKKENGKIFPQSKKITGDNWLQKKKTVDKSKYQESVKPGVSNAGSKLKPHGLNKETTNPTTDIKEKVKDPVLNRYQDRFKEPFTEKKKVEDPKSILKPKMSKDIETSKYEVKGSKLIGSSDMAGGTNNMSAFNMKDSISLKKYRDTKGELSLSPASSADHESVFNKHESSDVTRKVDIEPTMPTYDKFVNLGSGIKSDKTVTTSNKDKFAKNSETSAKPDSKFINTKLNKPDKDVQSKPIEINETKPAWMLEAEKRQKARGGKYEDPEFTKVKQLDQEKKGKDSEPIKPKTLQTNVATRKDKTAAYGSKPVEIKTTSPESKTEKFSHVIPLSPQQVKNEVSPRKELNVKVSTGGSRFKSPETSPRATSPNSKNNTALVSILSKQLGRSPPGESRNGDIIVPPEYGSQKVTSPSYSKRDSSNVNNNKNLNKKLDVPVIGNVSDKGINGKENQPRISPIHTRPDVKPAWSEQRTSTPIVTPIKLTDSSKKVIAAPSGNIESEYVLAEHPSFKCAELKTLIVPDKPFSIDSDDELSEVDSVDSSNSDSGQLVMREPKDRNPPPVRKVNAEKRLSSHYILQKMNDLDIQLREFERQGRAMEEKIRSGTDDSMDDNDQMLQWFELISQKNDLVRSESELMYIQKQQELEDRHATLEYEIRCLMSIPEEEKSQGSFKRESVMIEELMSVVTQRNSIVDSLEDDRIRYLREDQEIQEMLMNKGFAKNEFGESEDNQEKSKKKQSKEHKKKLKEDKKRQKEEQKRLEKEKKEKKKDKKKRKSTVEE